MLRSLPTKTPSPNARSKLGRRKPRAKKSTLGFFSDKQQGISPNCLSLSTSFSSACYLRTLVIAPIPMFFASRLIVAIMTAILTRCSLCVPRAGQHLSDHRSSERPDTLTAQTHHSSLYCLHFSATALDAARPEAYGIQLFPKEKAGFSLS